MEFQIRIEVRTRVILKGQLPFALLSVEYLLANNLQCVITDLRIWLF